LEKILMKAIICTKYGPPEVLQLRDVEKPVPRDNEVLVKVHASAVTSGDCRIRSFSVPLLFRLPSRLALGITRPRKPVLGMVVAGEVTETGRNVQRFKKGDMVFSLTGMRFGAYADYTCIPEDGNRWEDGLVALKPVNLSCAETAAIPWGGSTALRFWRYSNIRSGQTVLVYGASGAVGTAAVQLASYYGAEVTGVCSTTNLELVKSLGADTVIDYTQEDFSRQGKKYDIVFDAVGKAPASRCRSVLRQNGIYMSVLMPFGGPRDIMTTDDMVSLKDFAEKGILKPVIDRTYPLEQIADAHRYADTGHTRGNVVITMDHEQGKGQ
jgi:NADPH:quinone reductase-like Zn-dependent oxidoreductase